MKIKFKKIVHSLTGFSTPVFGASWNPPESDREIVRKLINFLEDRRALYNPYNIETPDWVAQSILEIRKELTDTLNKLDEKSDAVPHLKAMRADCRKYMNEVEHHRRGMYHFREYIFASLGELRASLGIQIAQLCVKYGIDIEDELATILPIEDDEKG